LVKYRKHHAQRVSGGLTNKRVLITAGPTRVNIDRVRVITNLATGETGRLIAKKLENKGAKVALLIGPMGFRQLERALKEELRKKKFDIVIHSAAVSDYRPKLKSQKKVSSGKKVWNLRLVPAPKLIDYIKRISPDVLLVGFKFQPQASRKDLIQKAKRLKKTTGADIVVANTLTRDKGYRAYLLGANDLCSGPYTLKSMMADRLIGSIEKFYRH